MSFSGNSSVTGSLDQGFLFDVGGSAQLTLTDTTGAATTAGGGCAMAGGLRASGSSTVTLSNYTCAGNVWPCIQAEVSATLHVSSSSLVSNCAGGIAMAGSARLTSTGSSYSNFTVNDMATVDVGGGSVVASGGDSVAC